VIWRALSKRARIVRHRRVTEVIGAQAIKARSPDGTPIPLQVDGDYIGDIPEARFGIAPGALLVVA
jgi:diacylglycerol kinase family enzyme